MCLELEMQMAEFYLVQMHRLGMILDLDPNNLELLLATGGLDMFTTRAEILVHGFSQR